MVSFRTVGALRFSCAKFGSLAGLLRQIQNFRVLNFSAGERKLKYPGPGFWTQPGISGSTRTHLFFVLLRASVPPWCKGLVFGCGYVAPCLRGAKVLSLILKTLHRVVRVAAVDQAGYALLHE